MKKCLLFVLILLLASRGFSQKKIRSIQLCAGKSWHGTGDLKGFSVDVLYNQHITKKVDFSAGLTSTIHYGKDGGFNSLFPGISPDERLIRFTTAGIQLSSLINYSVFYSHDNQLKIGVGPIVRFQSSSYPDSYGLYQNQNIFPEPFYVIYNYEKQNLVTSGYNVALTFLTKISINSGIGVKAFFQNDTNGDVITGISFIYSRLL